LRPLPARRTKKAALARNAAAYRSQKIGALSLTPKFRSARGQPPPSGSGVAERDAARMTENDCQKITPLRPPPGRHPKAVTLARNAAARCHPITNPTTSSTTAISGTAMPVNISRSMDSGDLALSSFIIETQRQHH
jgi:hypothetical protein